MTIKSAIASSKAFAFFRLARIENCLIVVVCALLGVHLAGGILVQSEALTAAIAAGLVLAFGNIINDICDVDVDRLAKPHRPIPSGRVTTSQAVAISAICAVGASLLGLHLGRGHFLVVAVMLLLSLVYSMKLKRTPLLGNLLVAAQSGFVVAFGASVYSITNVSVWAAALMVFLAILVFEVVKDLEDEEGDAGAGIHTIAHKLSLQGQRYLLGGLVTISMIAVTAIGLGEHADSALYWLVLLPMLPLALVAARMPRASRLSVYIITSKVLWLIGLVGLWTL